MDLDAAPDGRMSAPGGHGGPLSHTAGPQPGIAPTAAGLACGFSEGHPGSKQSSQ